MRITLDHSFHIEHDNDYDMWDLFHTECRMKDETNTSSNASGLIATITGYDKDFFWTSGVSSCDHCYKQVSNAVVTKFKFIIRSI